jgi:asparaginyl-tRNA synthetase
MPPTDTVVEKLPSLVGATVRLRGWAFHTRRKGKIAFLVLRDGSGQVQCVAVRGEIDDAAFDQLDRLPQESSVEVEGEVRADARSPLGVEVGLRAIRVVHLAEPYPITPKEHGVDFLMENRHLWLRSSRPHAVLRVRAEVEAAAQEWLNAEGFLRFDAPILTPCACEGTSDLFATEYFDLGQAFLSQSGQLYGESGMAAFGKIYCFGPTFRSEKSKTRRHLTEFWMIEPEVAFAGFEDNLVLQERFLSAVVARVLERRRPELEALGADIAALERVKPPFPRLPYDDAIRLVAEAAGKEEGVTPLAWGEDLGAPHEVFLSKGFDRPVFVTRYPSKIKAFYMQPDPARPEVALCADLLAPGYGELIGGSERIHDLALLETRVREHGLPAQAFRWYTDLRRFGSVPHAGFGMGIERAVSWIGGGVHIRETIPYPRMLYTLYP